MKSRKILSIVLALAMATVLFTGCSSKDKTGDTPKDTTKTEKPKDQTAKDSKKFVEKDGVLVYTDTKNSPFQDSGLEIQLKKGDKGSAKFIITDKEGKATVDYYIFDYDKNQVVQHKFVSAMGTEFYYYYDLDKKELTKIEDGEHKDTTEKTKASNRWDKAVLTMDENVKLLEKYYSQNYKMTIKEAVQKK